MIYLRCYLTGKSHLPSQVAVEKVLFLDEKVVIHKDTTNDTIKKLIAMGVQKFIRGDTEAGEDEQKYFLRISQYLSGRVPLPTFISLSKGVTHTDALHVAGKNRIPVICFKQKAKDVKILTIQSIEEFYLVKEHKIELKNPWKVIKACWKVCDVGYYETDDVEPEISTLSDMPNEFDHMAALICNFLIGVA
ncbi:uncharacterized protein LOC130049668 [Ostrea edulis]|uniref:uncharacterized protein LOC130049668 n=1 Tax=Ostrea edulis TaxID=37623 RepID=UPI0024AF69AF|nr:uncharacterized protein LOC130049668 [Ostrea edulis]